MDPRGPLRTLVSVEVRTDGAYVTLSCGHVRCFNQIYAYKVGTKHNCYACRESK